MGCLQRRRHRLPGESQSPEHGLLRNSFWPTAPTHCHSFGVHLGENELATFKICVHVQEGTGEASGKPQLGEHWGGLKADPHLLDKSHTAPQRHEWGTARGREVPGEIHSLPSYL